MTNKFNLSNDQNLLQLTQELLLLLIQIRRGLKNNTDYANFELRREKCIGFVQFDRKICLDYAIIRITRSLLYSTNKEFIVQHSEFSCLLFTIFNID